MSNKMCLVAGLAMVAFVTAPGFASTAILVNNSSFETLPTGGVSTACPSTGCAYDIGAISGWVSSGVSGQFQAGTSGTYFNSLPDGPTSAFSNGGTISQTVTPTVVLGQTYELLVDIGWRLDYPMTGSADLLINGTRYSATPLVPLVRGTFDTFAVTYTAVAADVGHSITIELQSSGAQGNFDNVQLLEDAPEPATFLLIAPALLALSGIKRFRQRA
jgi:hypothetical protein